MNHNHIHDSLTEYIDGTLSPSEMEKLKSHLIFCRDCQHSLTQIKNNIDKLKATPTLAPSADLEQKVIARMKKELMSLRETPEVEGLQPSWWKTWIFSMRGFAAATACVLALIVAKNFSPYLSRHERGMLSTGKSESIKKNAVDDKEEIVAQKHAETTNSLVKFKEGDKPNFEKTIGGTIDNNLMNKPQGLKLAEKSEGYQSGSRPDQLIKTPVAPLVAQRKLEARGSMEMAAAKKDISTVDVIKGSVIQQSFVSVPLKEEIIRDQKSLDELLQTLKTMNLAHPSLNQVDFTAYDVIAIYPENASGPKVVIQIQKIEGTEWERKPAQVVNYRLISNVGGEENSMILKTIPKFDGLTFFRKNR